MVTGAPKKIRGGFLLRLHGNADRSCGFAFDADTGKVIADLTRVDVNSGARGDGHRTVRREIVCEHEDSKANREY